MLHWFYFLRFVHMLLTGMFYIGTKQGVYKVVFRTKFNRIIKILIMITILCCCDPDDSLVEAESSINMMPIHKVDEDVDVLVVYSSLGNEMDEHVRLLDMLVSHFTTKVSFKPPKDVVEEDVKKATHLIYYGQVEENLSPSFLSLLASFSGRMLAIGYNVEQLQDHYSFLKPVAQELIDRLYLVGQQEEGISFPANLVIHVELDSSAEVIMEGSYMDKRYPFFIRHGHHYYFASYDISPPKSIFLGEALHHVFDNQHEAIHPGYIRLEDIHPLVDPDNMLQIAKILKEKQIPYMIAVIPVYTNPETGKQYHFSDSPQLLKVLKYMQENGGSIVLHGYTHQFRSSETGEGFEFWDVEYNLPIYHEPDSPFVLKTRKDFASDDLYEQYLQGLKAFEREYIKSRVTRGIQELVNYGLYPLAFEAPHYTMSQHGYQVVAEHFSTYVGQLQLSDKNWEIMTTAPYITYPTFLDGMVLLPETLGYVRPEDPASIEKMVKKAYEYQLTRDGMVAGFYHPYLGVEPFVELLNELEKIPNVSWIDLKQLDNLVQAEHVRIETKQGEIKATVERGRLLMSSNDFLNYHLLNLSQKLLWMVAFFALVGALLFIVIMVRLQFHHRGTGWDQFG